MLFEVILRNAVDKKAVLEDMADFFEELVLSLNQPCEARWTEFCILAEMILVVGELPNQETLVSVQYWKFGRKIHILFCFADPAPQSMFVGESQDRFWNFAAMRSVLFR